MRLGGFAFVAALVGGLTGAGPLRASGVEHVIDDADVETAGLCHLESYFSHGKRGQGLFVAAPACTRKTWPKLEIGGFVSRSLGADARTTVIGLAPKLKLREAGNGPGLALKGTLGYSLTGKRSESFSLLAPMTIALNKRLSVNTNVGWQWLRGTGHSAFLGAQAEYQATPRLELMGEVFGRADGPVGAQCGLRWTVARGRVDLDLAYGHYVDGATPHAVTLGVAVRFGTAA